MIDVHISAYEPEEIDIVVDCMQKLSALRREQQMLNMQQPANGLEGRGKPEIQMGPIVHTKFHDTIVNALAKANRGDYIDTDALWESLVSAAKP